MLISLVPRCVSSAYLEERGWRKARLNEVAEFSMWDGAPPLLELEHSSPGTPHQHASLGVLHERS